MAQKTLRQHLAEDLTFCHRADDHQVREFIVWMQREFDKIALITEVRHENPRCQDFEACGQGTGPLFHGCEAAEEVGC